MEKPVPGAIEYLDIDITHQGADAAEEEISQEFLGLKVTRSREKEGGPSGVLVKDRRGHDGGHDTGHDGLKFKLGFPVQDLRREQGGAQGSVEDGADAPGRAGQHQDAPIPDPQVHQGGRIEASPAPIWAMGPSAGGTAAADGEGRSQDLDRGHPLANEAAGVVEGFDHGIGAMPFRLRGQEKDQEAGGQTTQGGDEEKEPGAGLGHAGDQHRFHPFYRLQIAGGQVQDEVQGIFQEHFEEDGPSPARMPTTMLSRGQRTWLDQP